VAEGAEAVLVCYADDVLKAPYLPYVNGANRHHPFSISLLLTRPEGAPLVCRLSRAAASDGEMPEAALMRFLLDGADTTLGEGQPWRLERAVHAA